MRNRESAALSRKRKSNRVGELEIQVEALEEECRRLRLHAARLERGDINGNGKVNPPPEATATRPPQAMDKSQVNTAPAYVSTAPIISPAAYVHEEVKARQAGRGSLAVLPPAVIEQGWAEGGKEMGSSAAVEYGVVGCRVEPEAWKQDGARPFCADSDDANDAIDHLFTVLMAEEASEREAEWGTASYAAVGAGGEPLQCGKGGCMLCLTRIVPVRGC